MGFVEKITGKKKITSKKEIQKGLDQDLRRIRRQKLKPRKKLFGLF